MPSAGVRSVAVISIAGLACDLISAEFEVNSEIVLIINYYVTCIFTLFYARKFKIIPLIMNYVYRKHVD